MSSLLPIDVTHEDEADDHDVPTALSPYALMSENQSELVQRERARERKRKGGGGRRKVQHINFEFIDLQCKVRKLVSEKEG